MVTAPHHYFFYLLDFNSVHSALIKLSYVQL